MIWPGRRLALALLAPALLSLGLFATETVKPTIIVLDVVIAAIAVLDLSSLTGAGRIRAERRSSAVASLGEPQEVELSLENFGSRPRAMRVRDDLPETFTSEPGEFLVQVP